MLKKGSKILEASLLFALCAALCAGTWANARQSSISSDLLRLHIVADSDDEEEQAIKLRVRDRVLDYLRPELAEVETSDESKELIRSALSDIAAAAAQAAEGRAVTVSLSREFFPTKSYGDFSLPAGEYEALRIVLGEGKGHNWWCVVFPPLCTETVSSGKLQSVMNRTDYKIVTEEDGYELRFRTLEIWGELKKLMQNAE